jgi:hypothetical protein
LAVAFVLAGCGEAAAPSYSPPFTTLYGRITSSSIPTPAEVRVALVWKHRDPQGNILRAAQELAVHADFPVNFRLDITTLPPDEAMNVGRTANGTPNPSMRYATGTVVVYEDTDGNGRLDLAPIDAPAMGDRVLGTPQGISVLYLEAGAATASGAHPGFNLRREAVLADPAPGANPCQPSVVTPQAFLPSSTPLDISLTGSPELSREVCQFTPAPPAADAGCVGDAASLATPVQGDAGCSAPASVPQGAVVTCSSDKRAFEYKSCFLPSSFCGASSCLYGCGQLAGGEPAPSGWPCP